MANLCKIQIIGNVGRDPEQRYSQQGTMLVSFSVAVNQNRRNADGSFEQETEWFRITATGRLAETCQQYVTKGTPVFVDGRLRVDRWTAQDGEKRYTLDVFANDVRFLGQRPREEGADSDSNVRPIRGPSDTEKSDLEDLPF
jgi:single-strand DNA-binding protein